MASANAARFEPVETMGMLEEDDPNGIRTRVAAVKGRCPWPLDDRVVAVSGDFRPIAGTIYPFSSKAQAIFALYYPSIPR